MFNTYITNLMKHCENTGSQMTQNHAHNMWKHLRLIYRYSSYAPFTTLQMYQLQSNSSHIHISIPWSTLFLHLCDATLQGTKGSRDKWKVQHI